MSRTPVLAPASSLDRAEFLTASPRVRASTTCRDDSRLRLWARVRDFAVPWSMIETTTARRRVGDWVGACAAAGVDVDLDLRAVARTHGRDLAARVRDDLRHLAPDLLRWHLPRVAPDGLLRPGLTISLARYDGSCSERTEPVHLVVRTAPAWADAGQRIALTLWDGTAPGLHPHPRPDRRYRLDLHRHLWDARRAPELRSRCGTGCCDEEWTGSVPDGCAVDRWAAEAQILLRAERRTGPFVVRLGGRHRVVLEHHGGGLRRATDHPRAETSALPVLPDAATRVLPDLALLRSGAITLDNLHPLVAEALEPGYTRAGRPRDDQANGQQTVVVCRGERHRIGLVDGVLSALDHDPAELRREELLVALTGTPLPCLRVIDAAHRHPYWLTGVRERLDHGDTAGALAVVEGLLGTEAILRDGPLRDALESTARRRVTYGLFRAGLPAPGRAAPPQRRRRGDRRTRPRHASER
ncbi:hypothetical protein [Nocardia neocaledoniensis]|uniref:hypothetical protein n=1 Tax=Nocardia neocaledoniensis TaxID=236511 RepID=UPI003CC8072B